MNSSPIARRCASTTGKNGAGPSARSGSGGLQATEGGQPRLHRLSFRQT